MPELVPPWDLSYFIIIILIFAQPLGKAKPETQVQSMARKSTSTSTSTFFNIDPWSMSLIRASNESGMCIGTQRSAGGVHLYAGETLRLRDRAVLCATTSVWFDSCPIILSREKSDLKRQRDYARQRVPVRQVHDLFILHVQNRTQAGKKSELANTKKTGLLRAHEPCSINKKKIKRTMGQISLIWVPIPIVPMIQPSPTCTFTKCRELTCILLYMRACVSVNCVNDVL